MGEAFGDRKMEREQRGGGRPYQRRTVKRALLHRKEVSCYICNLPNKMDKNSRLYMVCGRFC